MGVQMFREVPAVNVAGVVGVTGAAPSVSEVELLSTAASIRGAASSSQRKNPQRSSWDFWHV